MISKYFTKLAAKLVMSNDPVFLLLHNSFNMPQIFKFNI